MTAGCYEKVGRRSNHADKKVVKTNIERFDIDADSSLETFVRQTWLPTVERTLHYSILASRRPGVMHGTASPGAAS